MGIRLPCVLNAEFQQRLTSWSFHSRGAWFYRRDADSNRVGVGELCLQVATDDRTGLWLLSFLLLPPPASPTPGSLPGLLPWDWAQWNISHFNFSSAGRSSFILAATLPSKPTQHWTAARPLAGPVLPSILPGGFNSESQKTRKGAAFDWSVKHIASQLSAETQAPDMKDKKRDASLV